MKKQDDKLESTLSLNKIVKRNQSIKDDSAKTIKDSDNIIAFEKFKKSD